jgi:hypothetical protein
MPAARSANISQLPGASFDACVLEWMQSTYKISFDFDTERALLRLFRNRTFLWLIGAPVPSFSFAYTGLRGYHIASMPWIVPTPRTAQPSPAQPSPAQPSPAQPSPAQPSPAQPSPAQRPFNCCSMHSSVAFPALAATGLSLCTLLYFRTSPIVRRATCAPLRPAPFAMSARGWGLRDWLLTEVQLARISCAGGMPIGRADAMDVDDARGALCRPPSHGWFAHGRATVTRVLPHLFGVGP